jgi:ADP-ribose pyrophosphatase YjhB (NUDIX family)
MKNNQITVSGAIIIRDSKGKPIFLLSKKKDEESWEIPKVIVRKGESSVRAAIRMANEQGGMSARVLEEAGRSTGVATINGKTVSQKFYYYLMLQKAGGEILGLEQFDWIDYSRAVKRLGLKREKDMLKSARDIYKAWEKQKKQKSR